MRSIRRFYKSATAEPDEGGYRLALDGRPARTPAQQPLVVPTAALGAAIAAEWEAQEEQVRPEQMPLTGLACTAIDRVRPQREQVIDEIAGYADTDLLCFRAGRPADLAERQRVAWQPLLDWAAAELGAPLHATEGVIPIDQPKKSLAAIRMAVAGFDEFRLAGLFTLTSGSGSVVIGLAVARGALSAGDAWAASQVDETWQRGQWGDDPEAQARRARLQADFEAGARFMGLLP